MSTTGAFVGRSAQYWLPALLLALPWLNPLTYGPVLPMVQALVTACALGAVGVCWAVLGTRCQDRARAVLLGWLLAATISAVLGLVQYFGWAGELGPWVNAAASGEAYANLRQRNQLATLLAMGLVALWGLYRLPEAGVFTEASAKLQLGATPPFANPKWAKTWAGYVVVMLLSTAVVATGSRTGLVQWLLLGALAVWPSRGWRERLRGFRADRGLDDLSLKAHLPADWMRAIWQPRGRTLLLFACACYVLAALLLPRLWPQADGGILRRLEAGESGCHSRLTMWSNVSQLISLRPWTGWGELAYAHIDVLYEGPRFCEILGNAHNLPLHLAVSFGLPVAVFLCGAFFVILWRARPLDEHQPLRQTAWLALALMLLHSMVEYPLWYAPFQSAFLLAVAVLCCKPRPLATSSAVKVPDRRRSNVALVGVALATWTICAYVGWDYWRISQIYLPVSQRAAGYRDNTLNKIRSSWLFQNQVKFAELGITPLTPNNAEHMNALAKEMLRFSPEASVLGKVIESALLLGHDQEATYYEKRFQIAYPQEYAAWKAK